MFATPLFAANTSTKNAVAITGSRSAHGVDKSHGRHCHITLQQPGVILARLLLCVDSVAAAVTGGDPANSCVLHHELHGGVFGLPGWGTDAESYSHQGWVLCCPLTPAPCAIHQG